MHFVPFFHSLGYIACALCDPLSLPGFEASAKFGGDHFYLGFIVSIGCQVRSLQGLPEKKPITAMFSRFCPHATGLLHPRLNARILAARGALLTGRLSSALHGGTFGLKTRSFACCFLVHCRTTYHSWCLHACFCLLHAMA